MHGCIYVSIYVCIYVCIHQAFDVLDFLPRSSYKIMEDYPRNPGGKMQKIEIHLAHVSFEFTAFSCRSWILTENSGIKNFYWEIQETRSPARKFKNPAFLAKNSNDFSGIQTLSTLLEYSSVTNVTLN